ncbi:FRG domain-containing protein [Enterococcus sp. CWB-B31]|uniref:FRG domain-containing protein n=1 Tax=Enterococcus sp. CWB-B31 TaxID=2885159 RepID=UPI001E42D28C|nr:FRG domain-containing protein [Enterococcus sp. CWB-B31]MCB5953953.1 FRG domain-containing protein [Enterococcus sp. CWB-B31]
MVWTIANTGMRNPDRLWEGLVLYANSSLYGNLNSDNEEEFVKLFEEKGLNENKKKGDNTLARKWKNAFERLSFIEPSNSYLLTDLGRKFVNARTEKEKNACFTIGLLEQKIYINPVSSFNPLIKILMLFRYIDGSGVGRYLTQEEMALFVLNNENENDIQTAQEMGKEIIYFRLNNEKLGDKDSKKNFVQSLEKKFERPKFATVKTYADASFRYLVKTGLFYREKDMLKVDETKTKVIKKILEKNMDFGKIYELISSITSDAIVVNSLEEYISVINKYVNSNGKNISVFRGETEIYDVPCCPNIFRTNSLNEDFKFEKNIFDQMTANNLSDARTYLVKAVDAQHGGFPSRLLDVTYNSLVALQFAVTPHFTDKKGEEKYNKDGSVYLFSIDQMFCPSGENITEAYNMIVKREKDAWINKFELFNRNHKLIDHVRSNQRIIAQQGAFILFQGNNFVPFEKESIKKIIIASSAKRRIEIDLKKLFGIHTGSIYPEAGNLVNQIVEKTKNIDDHDFNELSELTLSLKTIKKDLQNQLDTIYKKSFQNELTQSTLLESILELERKVKTYKLELLDLKENECFYSKNNLAIENLYEKFNLLVESIPVSLGTLLDLYGIELDIKQSLIDRGNKI